MKLFKIYLCGGMTKFGAENFCIGNSWRVCIKAALESYECNYRVFCCNPNDYYNFLDDTTYDSQKEIMNFDIYRLVNSDLIIVNYNDPYSIASACEIAIAHDHRIPIIGLCENGEETKLHPWLKEMTHKMFTDRNELLDYVRNYYLG